MDIKDGERTVIAKPVASRPSCSNFRSFTELLTGAINDSPPNVYSETTVAAIRPKTTRLKPNVNRALAGAEMFGTTVCPPSDNVLKSDGKPTVVHKPLAKLVSKTSVSLLENMQGNFNASTNQQTLASADARVQQLKIPIYNRHNLRSQSNLNVNPNTPSNMEIDQTTKPSKMPSQNMEDDPKSLASGSGGGRASYDGYNWRKYGQKQVKGSEYPRSYYKCTHPNCPVKKKVERSFDGQIAEIVYKGEHNHSKPQPPKRNSSGTQGQGPVSDGTGKDTKIPLVSNHQNETNECYEGRGLNQNEAGLSTHATYQGKSILRSDSFAKGGTNTGVGTPDNSFGPSGECEEGSKGLEGEDEEPPSKRRRNENQSKEAGISGEAVQEPRIVVQNSTDSEIVGDGFRWRKYGQKVVKGNPYPRSYYRCTSIKCNVRKHVERASDDPKAFITTYEGKHNHDMPVRTTNTGASESDPQAPSNKGKS